MSERKEAADFVKYFNVYPYIQLHVIPDVPGKTIKRPFDVFGSIFRIPIAIEFKLDQNYRVAPHQKEELLNYAAAGANSFVATIITGQYHSKDILFTNYLEPEKQFYLKYIDQKYQDIEKFIDFLRD